MKKQQKKYEKQEEERYFVTSIDSIDGKDVNTLTYQWERHKNLLTCKHGAIFKDNPLKVMYQAKVKWCTSLGLLKFCFLDIKFTRTSSFTHLFLSLSLSLSLSSMHNSFGESNDVTCTHCGFTMIMMMMMMAVAETTMMMMWLEFICSGWKG